MIRFVIPIGVVGVAAALFSDGVTLQAVRGHEGQRWTCTGTWSPLQNCATVSPQRENRPSRLRHAACFSESERRAMVNLLTMRTSLNQHAHQEDTAYVKNGSGGRLRRCHKCDYNLTGNTSGTCPECGTAVE